MKDSVACTLRSPLSHLEPSWIHVERTALAADCVAPEHETFIGFKLSGNARWVATSIKRTFGLLFPARILKRKVYTHRIHIRTSVHMSMHIEVQHTGKWNRFKKERYVVVRIRQIQKRIFLQTKAMGIAACLAAGRRSAFFFLRSDPKCA